MTAQVRRTPGRAGVSPESSPLKLSPVSMTWRTVAATGVGDAGRQFVNAAADMGLGGDAVRLRHLRIDANPAQIEAQNAKADGRGFVDRLEFERRIRVGRRFLTLLSIRDVDVDPGEASWGSALVAGRLTKPGNPANALRGMVDAKFDIQWGAGFQMAFRGTENLFPILREDQIQPRIEADLNVRTQSVQRPIGVGDVTRSAEMSQSHDPILLAASAAARLPGQARRRASLSVVRRKSSCRSVTS